MRFRSQVLCGKDVLFIGHEGGNAHAPEAWQTTGRWKISLQQVDRALSEHFSEATFGESIDSFVFFFEIAEIHELSSEFFSYPQHVCRYSPKRKEVTSSGSFVWSGVKELSGESQLELLIESIKSAILNVGNQRRQPKDFDYERFADEVVHFLRSSPYERFEAVQGG